MRWLLGKMALAAALVGLVLHLTVRDGHPALAPVFYALPWPLVGASFFVVALLGRGRRRKKFYGLVALLVLGGWFFQSCGWAFPASGNWKIITWNVARPRHPFPPLLALVRAEKPDVMALVEAGQITPGEISAYEHELPGYRVYAGEHGLACLVRGTILEGGKVSNLVNDSYLARVRVKIDAETLNVFLADLQAGPRLPRQPQLEMLANRTRGLPRTIVMGDFNTPLDSVYLAGMRTHFAEVMDGPHRGFRETWFYGLPLLSLDQIWLSRDLESRFATRRLTFASDHAPVIATVSPQVER